VKYITPKSFKDFCKNQKELIQILNHRMTEMEKHMNQMKTDIAVIKSGDVWRNKILWLIFGGMIATLFTLLLRTMFGI